jgi:hypothetical protein
MLLNFGLGIFTLISGEINMITKLNGNKVLFEVKINNLNDKIISYLSSLEVTSKSKMSDEDIDKLSEEISSNWWKKNKKRFINETNS